MLPHRLRRLMTLTLTLLFWPIIAEAGSSKAKPPAEPSTPSQEFLAVIRKHDPHKTLVVDAKPGTLPEQLIIVVPNQFHRLHYQERLQAAQALWQMWVKIVRPKQPDHARIKLVDLLGNEVGGSRALGGSLIWVQER